MFNNFIMTVLRIVGRYALSMTKRVPKDFWGDLA